VARALIPMALGRRSAAAPGRAMPVEVR
jgi:hypothetical protein